MKKILILIIFLALTSSLFFGYHQVLALSEAHSLKKPTSYVAKINGDVQIKKNNESEFIKATLNEKINEGDLIKTGTDGEVSVVYYDNAISTISPNSELRIDDLNIDDNNYAKTTTGLKLTFGHVWMRIMQLADKNSSFEIESSDAVATVRGTILDFEKSKNSKTIIRTVENMVEVQILEGKKEKIQLKENFEANLNKKTKDKTTIQPIDNKTKNSPWFINNKQKDQVIEKEINSRLKEENKKMAGILPNSKLYKLKTLSEKIRIITTNKEEKKNLENSFNQVRLAELVELNINKINTPIDSALNKNLNLNQLDFERKIFRTSEPSINTIELRNKIEEEIINNSSQENKEYLKNKLNETIINEAEILKNLGNKEQYEAWLKKYQQIINLIEQNNLLFRIKDPAKITPSETINLLNVGAKIQDAVKNLQKDIENSDIIQQAPQTAPKVETTNTKTITTENTAQPAPSSLTTTIKEITTEQVIKPSTPKLTSLKITSPHYNILAGDSVALQATAMYSDNSTKNVTSLSQWTLTGDIGTITSSGILTSSNAGGDGIASATYEENGITVSGSSPTITALSITP